MQTGKAALNGCDNALYYFLALLTLTTVAFIGLMSAVPPVSRDALTHHLYVPKLYLNAGRIIELPHIPFSYYPMNLDLLYIIPLIAGSDIIPKYIHFLFAMGTAWLLYRHASNRYDRLYGLFAAFFFMSVPIVIKLSTTIYVDLGLIFFSTGSILCIEGWRNNRFTTYRIITAGVYCGLALGTKYNGIVTFVLLSLLVPFIYLKSQPNNTKNQLKAIRHAAIFSGTALIVFSPWMIRNIHWTGNPLYPLYQGVFQKLDPASASTDNGEKTISDDHIKWNPFNVRSLIYKESKWETALIPIRVFFQGKDDNPKYFDGVLLPWLLLFPLLLFIKARDDTHYPIDETHIFLAFSILYLLIVYFLQDMRIRWILPIVPPLVLLSVGGLYRLGQWIGEVWRYLHPYKDVIVLGVATCCILSISVPYTYQLFQKTAPFDYLSGKVSRDEYITRYRPEFPAIRYANNHLDRSLRFLGVYLGNRGYYFKNPVVFSNRFVEDYIQPFNNSHQVRENILGNNIDVLLVNYAMINKRATESLSFEQQRLLTDFFHNETKQEFSENGFGVFSFK